MKSRKKQVTVYVDANVYDELKEIANNSEILTLGAIIRRALKKELEYLKKNKDDII